MPRYAKGSLEWAIYNDIRKEMAYDENVSEQSKAVATETAKEENPYPHTMRISDNERAFLFSLVQQSYLRQAEVQYTQPSYLMMHIRLMQHLRDIE